MYSILNFYVVPFFVGLGVAIKMLLPYVLCLLLSSTVILFIIIFIKTYIEWRREQKNS